MYEKELRRVYVETVTELAEQNKDVFVIEADLSNSIGTLGKKAALGNQFVNVGIMEAEAVGVSAGISVVGGYPYFHTFAPFATRRAYDQIFLSLAYAKNKGVILGSDPGICAEKNGGTHMCFEDLALMRAIPDMLVYDVSEPSQMEKILKRSYEKRDLCYIRSSRKAFANKVNAEALDLEKGYTVLKKGTDLTIFVSGVLCGEALKGAEILAEKGYSVAVVELFRIKPINQEILIEAAIKGPIVTVDNHSIIGGLGSAVAEVVAENHPARVKRLGITEKFGQVGSIEYLKEQYGLKAEDIAIAAQELFR